jgi:hypothetical protein
MEIEYCGSCGNMIPPDGGPEGRHFIVDGEPICSGCYHRTAEKEAGHQVAVSIDKNDPNRRTSRFGIAVPEHLRPGSGPARIVDQGRIISGGHAVPESGAEKPLEPEAESEDVPEEIQRSYWACARRKGISPGKLVFICLLVAGLLGWLIYSLMPSEEYSKNVKPKTTKKTAS